MVSSVLERPQPLADERELHDAWEVEELLGPGSECIQLSPGRFAGKATTIRLGGVELGRLAANCAIALHVEIPSNEIAVGYAAGAEYFMVCHDTTLALSPPGGADVTWLRIDLRALALDERDALEARIGVGSRLISSRNLEFIRLRAAVEEVMTLSRLHPGLVSGEAASRRFERDAFDLVSGALGAGAVKAHDGARIAHAFALVRQAEQYMWDNVEEPITLDRVCEAVHCRTRRLIYAFKDVFGMGPMSYFKICRLNAVRRAFQKARSGRIFDIAADFGFWHMGHFSADYKRMFGMTASQTIAGSIDGQG